MKTPVSILQELMVKRNDQPRYDLVYSGGSANDPIFRYTVSAGGVTVEAEGRSKKLAKHQVALAALSALAKIGIFHPQHKVVEDVPGNSSNADPDIHINYIMILRDYCSEYNMPLPEYALLSESGPPHLRNFVMECRVGTCVRQGIGNSKQIARRQAAGKVLDYLRQNLTRVISECDDDQAVAKMGDVAKKKFIDNCPEIPWKPNLGQKVADYHTNMFESFGEETLKKAQDYLYSTKDSADPLGKIDKLLKLLELEYDWVPMPTIPNIGGTYQFLNIPHFSPPITMTGAAYGSNAKHETAVEALDFFEDIFSRK